jgi:hypothetical protein
VGTTHTAGATTAATTVTRRVAAERRCVSVCIGASSSQERYTRRLLKGGVRQDDAVEPRQPLCARVWTCVAVGITTFARSTSGSIVTKHWPVTGEAWDRKWLGPTKTQRIEPCSKKWPRRGTALEARVSGLRDFFSFLGRFRSTGGRAARGLASNSPTLPCGLLYDGNVSWQKKWQLEAYAGRRALKDNVRTVFPPGQVTVTRARMRSAVKSANRS